MTKLAGLSQTWKKLTKLISLDKSQLFQAILNLLARDSFPLPLSAVIYTKFICTTTMFFLDDEKWHSWK